VGKRIPSEIKNKVLDSWLFGIPSNMIATCNGIGMVVYLEFLSLLNPKFQT
jgi:hypothetical protein